MFPAPDGRIVTTPRPEDCAFCTCFVHGAFGGVGSRNYRRLFILSHYIPLRRTVSTCTDFGLSRVEIPLRWASLPAPLPRRRLPPGPAATPRNRPPQPPAGPLRRRPRPSYPRCPRTTPSPLTWRETCRTTYWNAPSSPGAAGRCAATASATPTPGPSWSCGRP